MPRPKFKTRVTINNRRGLHARAAARFVKTAESFDAKITVEKDGMAVCGTSIMGLMMLAAARGQDIEIAATGPEAEQALDGLVRLVGDGFNEN